jgi:uncharacterized protein
VITLDTSALYALINRRDTSHERIKRALLAEGGPYLVPVGILAEITYLVERRVPMALDPFLADLQSGAFSLDCGLDDLPRIRQLVRRYADLPLGYADATVVACAERNGQRVLTLDAHVGAFAREGAVTTVELPP